MEGDRLGGIPKVAATGGRRVRLSRPRLWVADLMAACRKLPIVSLRVTLDVAPAAAARRALADRPGWSALLMKACGRAAAEHPALRRAYMKLPWPHFYEHPCSVATLIVEREVDGEAAVLADQFPRPEACTLAQIAHEVRRLNTAPVESIGGFRRIMRSAAAPLPVRRLAIAGALHVSGAARAKYFGTFAINSLRAPNAEMTHFISPLAISLHYGEVAPGGRWPILVGFDHRVIDARALLRLFDRVAAELNGDLVNELRAMASPVGIHEHSRS